MNDPDNTVILPAVNNDDLPERLWAYERPPATTTTTGDTDEEPPASEISGRLGQPRLPAGGAAAQRPVLARHRPGRLRDRLRPATCCIRPPTRLPPRSSSPTIRTRTRFRAMQTNVTLAESRPVARLHQRNLASVRASAAFLRPTPPRSSRTRCCSINVSAPSAARRCPAGQDTGRGVSPVPCQPAAAPADQLVLRRAEQQVAQAQQQSELHQPADQPADTGTPDVGPAIRADQAEHPAHQTPTNSIDTLQPDRDG